MMLKHVVRPVFETHGFTVVRSDEITKTGIITKQGIRAFGECESLCS
jgi:hypothetical protein